MRPETLRVRRSGALHSRMFFALWLMSITFPANGRDAEHWLRLATPHFEMYTTNSEKQGTAALNVFEQVRYFYLQNTHSKRTPDTQVRIIAFRSDQQYKPYRVNEGAFAYYVRSRKADYIVMQDISPEHYQAAVHEYTHLIVEHLGLNLPTWLNEGLADVYSSLETKGDQALVGRTIPGRATVLFEKRWMDWNALFAVAPDSPYYNESAKMSIFYAQSWALTHMLMLGKGYQPHFSKFLAAMAAGKPATDCLQTVYGKSVAEVSKDLQAYLLQSSVQALLFDVDLNKPDLRPEVSVASEFKLQLALADLLASQKRKMGEAEERLSRLAKEHPESAEVEESLGYLAWSEGNTTKAQERFKLAFDGGSKNPEMLLHYAELMRDSKTPSAQIVPVLQSAVAIKPGYRDALLELGLTATDAGQWGVANRCSFADQGSGAGAGIRVLFGARVLRLQIEEPEAGTSNGRKGKGLRENSI